MIIVSQDKTATTQSLDLRIDYTYNESREFPNFKKEIVCIVDRKYNTILGEYSTEERAKEVLQEIINKYKQWNKDANNAVTIMPKVYEMPVE